MDGLTEPALVLDPQKRGLIRGAEFLRLTPRECRVVELLAERKGLVERSHLILLLWDGDEPENTEVTNALTVTLSNIRRKTRARQWPALIRKNTRGDGAWVRLTEPVEILDCQPPVVIPYKCLPDFRRLLLSHPDHAAAERILAEAGV